MSTQEMKSAPEPCPVCLLQRGDVNPLINRPGQYAMTCSAKHEFNDTEEFRVYQKQARQRFPALYAAPAETKENTAQFAGKNIVILPETKKTMEEACGMVFTSDGDLKGAFIAAWQENKDLESEIKRLRAQIATLRRPGGSTATTGSGVELAPGQYIVTVPEWALEGGIAAAAEHQGMTEQDWIQNEVSAYLESYFNPRAAASQMGMRG